MASPEENLQLLKVSKDYATLSSTLEVLISDCPIQYIESFKVKLATTLREKQLVETKQASGHARALQDIDLKYRNLAMRLHDLMPTSQPVRNLPVRNNSSSLAGFGATVIKNWIQARQKQLLGFGVALGAVGGLAFVFNKIYGKSSGSPLPVKNPDELRDKKFEGFEKTLTALQKLRSLNKMSKSGSFDEYEGFLSGKKKKKGEVVDSDSKRIDWNKEESYLMSSADKAMKALSNFKLPEPEVPLLTTNASLEDTFATPKKRRKRKEKEESLDSVEDVEAEELPIEEEIVQEENDTEQETFGRLIPVVKRTKKVKRI